VPVSLLRSRINGEAGQLVVDPEQERVAPVVEPVWSKRERLEAPIVADFEWR